MCFNIQQTTKSLKSISKISGHPEEIMVTKSKALGIAVASSFSAKWLIVSPLKRWFSAVRKSREISTLFHWPLSHLDQLDCD